MTPTPARVEVVEEPEALAHRVAQWITDLAASSPDRFAICLSGGSTPRRLYQLLADAPYRDALPWDRVHWICAVQVSAAAIHDAMAFQFGQSEIA